MLYAGFWYSAVYQFGVIVLVRNLAERRLCRICKCSFSIGVMHLKFKHDAIMRLVMDIGWNQHDIVSSIAAFKVGFNFVYVAKVGYKSKYKAMKKRSG